MISVKLAISHPSDLDVISRFEGKTIQIYLHPGNNQLYGVVSVNLCMLLPLLRVCLQRDSIRVSQIYDFFH